MASHEEKGAEAASKKQHFGDIYNELTPVAFKSRIMDSLDYICDDYTKSEFERLGLVEFCSGVPADANSWTCAVASATPPWPSFMECRSWTSRRTGPTMRPARRWRSLASSVARTKLFVNTSFFLGLRPLGGFRGTEADVFDFGEKSP